MRAQDAAPGKYAPRCAKCQRRFELVVQSPGAAPVVRAIASEARRDAVTNDIATALGLEAEELLARRGASAAGITVPPPDRHSPEPHPHDPAATLAPPAPQRHSSPGDSTAGRPAPQPHVAPPAPPTLPPAGASPRGAAETAPPSPSLHYAPQGASPAGRAAMAETLPPDPSISQTLGGYQLIARLGEGGMGAVYRARQLSLERDVAVKVMHPQWARDAEFVSRFTREAFAAAQLVHHNVVQIYDIGAQEEDAGQRHYFSMEFVRGQNLLELIEQQGRLDPRVAATFVLQAARALKFAHEHGMVHRDIKPANLLLNDQSIVKVADLGLVKTRRSSEQRSQAMPAARAAGSAGSAQVTDARVSMGTPAYMPPEQAADAHAVDARADIYSLGCTFFHLLVGKPPFEGATVDEVLLRHVKQLMPAAHERATRVPPELSAIIQKMAAKDPDARHASMGEVVADLEEFLGVSELASFSPREEHVVAFEGLVKSFSGGPLGAIRSRLIIGFFAACALAFLITAVAGSAAWLVGATAVLPLAAGTTYVIVIGLMRKTDLSRALRRFALSRPISAWIKVVVAILLLGGALALSGLLFPWLGVAAMGVGLAFAFQLAIDAPLAAQRAPVLQKAIDLLRSMRLRGLGEDQLRHFVCRYAGNGWEAFYEALFGYEAKLAARAKWGRGERGQERAKCAAWRDPIIRWLADHYDDGQQKRQQRHLQRVEAKRLEAQGVSVLEANRKAKLLADEMLARAADLRHSTLAADRRAKARERRGERREAESHEPEVPAVSVHALTAGLEEERPQGLKGYKRHGYIGRRVGGPLDILFGPQMRFLLGGLILIAFSLWLYQNRQAAVDPLRVLQGERVDPAQQQSQQAIVTRHTADTGKTPMNALTLPWVPEWLCKLLGSFNAGIAGGLLVLGAIFRGKLLGIALLAGALLIFFGHALPVREFATLTPDRVTLAAGVGISLLAIVFLRDAETA